MKKPILLGLGAALALTSAALAQPGPRGQRADLDGDGKVTLAETQTASKARFARMDTNRDGKVTKAELEAVQAKREAARAERGAGRGERFFGMMDRNGDGAVSQAEFDAAAKARFQRADANKDGVLTAEERQRGGRGKR